MILSNKIGGYDMSIQLNKSQEKAMKAKEHRVLVVAAAGSGKSRVLTERIKYLLKQGYT